MRRLAAVCLLCAACCRTPHDPARAEQEWRELEERQRDAGAYGVPSALPSAIAPGVDPARSQDEAIGKIVLRVYARHGAMPYDITRSRRSWVRDARLSFKTDGCAQAFVDGIVEAERDALREARVVSVSCLGATLNKSATSRPLR